MKNQVTKKNQTIYQIYGLNGCSNIINNKKIKIIRIDIMIGGNAEKKQWVNSLARLTAHPVQRMPKNQFLKKYSGKRTQGIVILFKGRVIKNMPSLANIDRNECLAKR